MFIKSDILIKAIVFISLLLSASYHCLGNSQDEKNLSCWKVYFVSQNDGWVICATSSASYIMNSADGGKTWERQYKVPDESLLNLEFIDNKNGWAVGTNGTILHTIDGGSSWTSVKTGIKETLTSITLVNKSEIWVAGTNGLIGHTKDGGNSWNSQTYLPGTALLGIAFANRSRGFAIGYGKILSTENGGKSWEIIESEEWKHLGILEIKQDSGWISAETALLSVLGNKIDLTGNILPEQGKISGISFIDEQNGWIIKTRTTEGLKPTSEGLILKTENGGKSWSKASSYKSPDDLSCAFVSVFFVNKTNGWVLSTDGTLLTTIDGGKNWTGSSIENSASVVSLNAGLGLNFVSAPTPPNLPQNDDGRIVKEEGWQIPSPKEKREIGTKLIDMISEDRKSVRVMTTNYAPVEKTIYSEKTDDARVTLVRDNLILGNFVEYKAKGKVFLYTIFARRPMSEKQEIGSSNEKIFVYQIVDRDGDGKFETLLIKNSKFLTPSWVSR